MAFYNNIKKITDLKAQHPEALLLFHDTEFGIYFAFFDDAMTLHDITGSLLMGKDDFKGAKNFGVLLEKYQNFCMSGFASSDLDFNLPKLISAGKRVAIIDDDKDIKKQQVIEDGDDIKDVVDLYEQQQGGQQQEPQGEPQDEPQGEEKEYLVRMYHNPATMVTTVRVETGLKHATPGKLLEDLYYTARMCERKGEDDNIIYEDDGVHGKVLKLRTLGNPDEYKMFFVARFSGEEPDFLEEREALGQWACKLNSAKNKKKQHKVEIIYNAGTHKTEVRYIELSDDTDTAQYMEEVLDGCKHDAKWGDIDNLHNVDDFHGLTLRWRKPGKEHNGRKNKTKDPNIYVMVFTESFPESAQPKFESEADELCQWAMAIERGQRMQAPKQQKNSGTQGKKIFRMTTKEGDHIECYDINSFNKAMKEHDIVKVELENK